MTTSTAMTGYSQRPKRQIKEITIALFTVYTVHDRTGQDSRNQKFKILSKIITFFINHFPKKMNKNQKKIWKFHLNDSKFYENFVQLSKFIRWDVQNSVVVWFSFSSVMCIKICDLNCMFNSNFPFMLLVNSAIYCFSICILYCIYNVYLHICTF